MTNQRFISDIKFTLRISNSAIWPILGAYDLHEIIFSRRTLNPFPMGSRPFGSPFNFSYFPLVSASIPFANLFYGFLFSAIFVVTTKVPEENNFNQMPCSISCCKNQNVHNEIFLRFFEKIRFRYNSVNHPTNNHLRIR